MSTIPAASLPFAMLDPAVVCDIHTSSHPIPLHLTTPHLAGREGVGEWSMAMPFDVTSDAI